MKKFILIISSFSLLFLGFIYFRFLYKGSELEYTSISPTATVVEDNMNELAPPTESKIIPSQVPIEDTSDTSVLNKIPTKESLRQLPSGTILNLDDLGNDMLSLCFYHEEINTEIQNRIQGLSYGKDCTVLLSDLRYVRVLYFGFDKETHIGELIVNQSIADDIVAIFLELYELEYPIEQMVLVDNYDADDEVSMSNNNTSGFNYRTVAGTTSLSKHALGLAIDINPLYNPYVVYTGNGSIISPSEGEIYADRSLFCEYYIKENDPCYNAFIQRGFTWGGSWKSSSDYQHFQKSIVN